MMSSHLTHLQVGHSEPWPLSYKSFICMITFPRHLLCARTHRCRAGPHRSLPLENWQYRWKDVGKPITPIQCVICPNVNRPREGVRPKWKDRPEKTENRGLLRMSYSYFWKSYRCLLLAHKLHSSCSRHGTPTFSYLTCPSTHSSTSSIHRAAWRRAAAPPSTPPISPLPSPMSKMSHFQKTHPLPVAKASLGSWGEGEENHFSSLCVVLLPELRPPSAAVHFVHCTGCQHQRQWELNFSL